MTYSNDFIYDQYSQGYTVLFVDKNINSFVINRDIFSISPNSKLYGHYVSKVFCNNISIKKGNIDGVFLKSAILGDSTSDIFYDNFWCSWAGGYVGFLTKMPTKINYEIGDKVLVQQYETAFVQQYSGYWYVKKNDETIIINGIEYLKIETDCPYVSSTPVDGGYITNMTKQLSSTKYGDINMIQLVMLNGDINNSDVNDKYDTNYVSLSLRYNSDDTYTKYYTLNNNDYGYSYFYDLSSSIKNCNIYSGNYYNCSISSTSSGKTIKGGYYNYCYIDNYNIYDGYFYNSNLNKTSCVWYYGKWDSGTFTLTNWKDGIFINGVFGDGYNFWQKGDFMDGIWRGNIWLNGNFYGGLFEGTGITSDGKKNGVEWINGKFSGGKMLNTSFNSIYIKNATILGGELNNISMNSGVIHGGNFYNSAIKNTEIHGGTYNVTRDSIPVDNYFVNNKIYDGDFNGVWYNPTLKLSGNTSVINSVVAGVNQISDSTIYNGKFKYCEFYNNTIENGDFKDNFFYSPTIVNNGKFYGVSNNSIYSDFNFYIKSVYNSKYLSYSGISPIPKQITSIEWINTANTSIPYMTIVGTSDLLIINIIMTSVEYSNIGDTITIDNSYSQINGSHTIKEKIYDGNLAKITTLTLYPFYTTVTNFATTTTTDES